MDRRGTPMRTRSATSSEAVATTRDAARAISFSTLPRATVSGLRSPRYRRAASANVWKVTTIGTGLVRVASRAANAEVQ